MANLISNIRKASIPLQESSKNLGRLMLQLGQAGDSTLDAETLAELRKQESIAACQELEKADAAAAAAAAAGGDGGAAGDDGIGGDQKVLEGKSEESSAAAAAVAVGDDGESNKDGVVQEESSTTMTAVDLCADASQREDVGSNNSSSHKGGGGGGSSGTSSTASSSLMHSSSVHSTASSSHHGPITGGALSPLPRSARSSREPSLVLSGSIHSAVQRKEAGSAEVVPRKASVDGPVTVVLQGFAFQDDDKLVVCESKALAHLFTRIRNRETSPQAFRFYASRMMRILAEEGIACLESSRQFITTPTAATFSSPFVDESNVCVVSILRAGDALAEAAQACLPTAPVGKILIQRDEESSDKHPVLFYNKLPTKIATMRVLLCDPMLATGGSALMAIRCLLEAGVKEAAIIFVTVVVCPEGLGAVRAEFPEVTIVTGAIDDCLDERCYILPGLGDFGDRFFGTVS